MHNSEIANFSISVNGFKWIESNQNSVLFQSIKKKFSFGKKISEILSKKVSTEQNLSDFLDPKLRNLLPDPWVLKNMREASEYIAQVIIKKTKIGIFGDFDVDGITSTSAICLFLQEMNIPFEFYIPNRIIEGYGPNIDAFKKLKEKGCQVIITVDCGITSNKVIEEAKNLGIKTIIIDHHLQAFSLPDADFIINPNQEKDYSGLNNLAAVGVVFLFLISLKRELKKNNFFKNKKEPNLINLVDLVALGTVCDLVKFDLVNRALVKSGLELMKLNLRLSLKSLLKNSGLNEEINEYHLGFIIGPKINAGGRIADAKMAVDLFISKDLSIIEYNSEKLSKFNNERKNIQRSLENRIVDSIDLNSKILFAHGQNWHVGIIGIVASRIATKFLKPVILISETDDLCKGSCRSVNGFNVGMLIQKARDKEILISGGGHEMAAGLSIQKDNLKKFRNFIEQYPYENIFENMFKYYDIELDILNINKEFYNELCSLAPYGPGNSKPKILLKNCFLKDIRRVGQDHLSCKISNFLGKTVNAIVFKAFDNKLGKFLIHNHGESCDIVCYLRENTWNGASRIEIEIIDIFI
tara:strand:- start:616 stop:2361 length:1746 start_codon:yes stop_codon:yes gene_type:complete